MTVHSEVGYHDTNMELLRPPERVRLKPVFGTAVGMSDGSIEVVRNQLALMFAGNPSGVVPAMQVSNMNCAALFDYHSKRPPG
jgi:hypothetical protein